MGFFFTNMADNFDINFKPTASPVNQEADIFANINKGYSGAIAGQQTVPQLITGYNEKFGIPDMQASIARDTGSYDALGNSIRNMPKEIAQRSQESILTQGQKDRQVQAESAPLLQAQGMLGQKLSRDQANLGVAQSNASQMVSAEQVQQEKELSPWLKQYDNESILSAMRMSGWTFENQSELTRLIQNQQAGITLSEGEKNRANQLAIAEKGFENALKLQGMQDASKLATFTPYATKPAGSTLYNAQTGGQKGYQIVSL